MPEQFPKPRSNPQQAVPGDGEGRRPQSDHGDDSNCRFNRPHTKAALITGRKPII